MQKEVLCFFCDDSQNHILQQLRRAEHCSLRTVARMAVAPTPIRRSRQGSRRRSRRSCRRKTHARRRHARRRHTAKQRPASARASQAMGGRQGGGRGLTGLPQSGLPIHALKRRDAITESTFATMRRPKIFKIICRPNLIFTRYFDASEYSCSLYRFKIHIRVFQRACMKN